MKLNEKVSSEVKQICDLDYAYVMSGNGVYIKRVNLSVYQKQRRYGSFWENTLVELFYLNSKGGETDRQYTTMTLYDLLDKIQSGECVPLDGNANKLLPAIIKITAFRSVGTKGMVVKSKSGKIFYGESRWSTVGEGSSGCWNEFSAITNLNRSSKGWSFDSTIKTNTGLKRIRVRIKVEGFREVSKEDLMEILV